MNLEDFTGEVSYHVEVRIEEITKLYNLQKNQGDAIVQNAIRRSSVCLYYAHIEGFVYFVFTHYINAINSVAPKVKDVVDEIKAASYHADLIKLFTDKKHRFFRKDLPDDAHLHSLARQVEFLSDIAPLWGDATINIGDKYINTESNVGKHVLQKLLYKVGLDYREIRHELYTSLARLLDMRNAVAHGSNLDSITKAAFDEYYKCTKTVITELERIVIDAYTHRRFLASTATVEDLEAENTI